mmetsp:Transcript_74941/g.148918  ORF Transcript_74941/g.148918 Transcript_74941/m.148918 type:complete len:105 (+) Transcript_74941:224-538(+)|eukprot:CAMPEP_0174715730 /NCGR_PEP_ID=MMETSP1094-20130205/22149_1 /TAXON_ID=156173 /ORGANISM="Chrysochromulina brevifilum, Strain UTEX LB 985" /LENGTH=104 /DNA_ID=CAMNT_0015915359 /DNA_START=217 /DNA_END=531 /DNA_ORIENTATION=-
MDPSLVMSPTGPPAPWPCPPGPGRMAAQGFEHSGLQMSPQLRIMFCRAMRLGDMHPYLEQCAPWYHCCEHLLNMIERACEVLRTCIRSRKPTVLIDNSRGVDEE